MGGVIDALTYRRNGCEKSAEKLIDAMETDLTRRDSRWLSLRAKLKDLWGEAGHLLRCMSFFDTERYSYRPPSWSRKGAGHQMLVNIIGND